MPDPLLGRVLWYEPSTPPDPEAEPQPGDGSWLELYTTDALAAL